MQSSKRFDIFRVARSAAKAAAGPAIIRREFQIIERCFRWH